MALVGISNFHFALLTKDDETGVEYDAMQGIKGLISVNINPASNSSTLYADNGPFDTATTLGEVEVSVNLADLTLEQQAAILGHTIEGGVLVSKASDDAPYLGCAFESLKANGKTRYIKLLKGKFQEPQEQTNTKADKIEFQTPTITGKFVCRAYDKAWKKISDTDSADYTDAIGFGWYASMEVSA